MPPQAPPKPRAAISMPSSDVQNALFIYSSKSPLDFQNALGASVKHHVIRT